MTREEIMNDYELLNDSYDNSLKKSMKVKYIVDSNKKADILTEMLYMLRSLRFETSNYDEIDIVNFSRMNVPDRYNLLSNFLDEEPLPFVKYLYEYWKKKADKIGYRYSYSIADKYILNRTKNFERYIKEHSIQYVEEMKIRNHIVEMLQNQMVDFKKRYLKSAELSAKFRYENSFKNEKLKYINIAYTLDEYIKKEVESALRDFDYTVISLAARIMRKKLDYNKLQISNVYNDPKFFEMNITDGNIKLYARSIIAAEYSDKVSTHLRFIIT